MRLNFLQAIIDLIRGKKTLERELLEITLLRQLLGSYSQHGEDLILTKLLKRTKNLFYIDVGANHPEKLSNTKYFYERGSRGINIDANPELIKEFYVQRPEDINLNIGIAPTEGEMTFYVLDSNDLSSFSKSSADENCVEYNSKIRAQINVKTSPLVKIIEEYATDKTIDFLSVDAEGFDLKVLQSNDWQKYRPRFVLVETNQDLENILSFMLENKYKVVYKNYVNYIFKDTLSK